MDQIGAYKLVEELDRGRFWAKHRGRRIDDGESVAIFVLNSPRTSSSKFAQFKRDCEILRSKDFENVARLFDIIEVDEGFAVVEELYTNMRLSSVRTEFVGDLASFFEVALQLTSALGDLHLADIVHGGIKPSSILIDLESKHVKLTDFGAILKLNHAFENMYDPEVIGTHLAYISPEQTGRVNRTVDYRTDLYSLGIVFYELLSGHVPFNVGDPLETIHAHIAKKPIPLPVLEPSIPTPLSSIVLKLLQKDPEDRYQSSFGLLADLKECRKRLTEGLPLEDFALASKDIPIKLNIPQKLYGRQTELDSMRSFFDHLKRGSKEILIIEGKAGIGKSALAYDILKVLAKDVDHVIVGTYEQSQKDVPYSGLVQAFSELARQILSRGKEEIDRIRKDFEKALGQSGKVITDAVPEMELIVGKQASLPAMSTEESENRFNIAFCRFVGIFAQRQTPLLLFLDDLHLADRASFELVDQLLLDPNIKALWFMGSFRENEVYPSHPIFEFFNNVNNHERQIRRIHLNNLREEDIACLINDTLPSDPEASQNLAKVICDKTNGSPLFVSLFLKSLHDDGYIALDLEKGWTWDLDRIRALQVTDNVIDLMVEKLSGLKGSTLEIIKICSCIGNTFDVDTLVATIGRDSEEILEDLFEAVYKGFISVSDSYFTFQHDRILEAAYFLTPDEERQAYHLKIGRAALASSLDSELQDKVFFIANQLNRGAALIDDPHELLSLSRLNYQAGIRAKNAASYGSALHHFRAGIQILDDEQWTKNYDLVFSLYAEAIEVAFLVTEYDQMAELFEVAKRNARNLLDEVKLYRIKINTLTAQNRLVDSLNLGLQTLALLGHRFPTNPTNLHVAYALLKTKTNLGRRSIEDLAKLDSTNDPFIIAAVDIMASVGSVAFLVNNRICALLACSCVQLAIAHGCTPDTPYGLASFGAVLCILGEIDPGYRFGQVAIELLKKIEEKRFEIRVLFTMECYLRHRKNHIADTLPRLYELYHKGLASSDLEFSAFSLNVYTYHALASGLNLQTLESETRKNLERIRTFKQAAILRLTKVYHQTLLNLLRQAEHPCLFAGPAYDESQEKPMYLVSVCKLLLCVVFNEYDIGHECSLIVGEKKTKLLGTTHLADYYYYDSIIKVERMRKATGKQYKSYLRKISQNQKQLAKFASHGPMNWRHKHDLIEAEIEASRGRHNHAMHLFEQAIGGAKKSRHIQDEAIANERASRYYRSRGFESIADAYLLNAYRCYDQWGATAKQRQLEKEYPRLELGRGKDDFAELLTTSATNDGQPSSVVFDINTAIKAARVISSEILLGELLDKLIRLSMENAGAEKGFIILREDGQYLIQASARVDTDEVSVLTGIPVEKSEELCTAIVNYVIRTQMTLLLGNASEDGSFVHDSYIIKNRSKSIICAPIINQGQLTGLFYFENNLTVDAFVFEQLEMLKILASQVAISIEKAKLYQSLERSNAELANALSASKETARVKSEFLANISHELRSPLNAVINIPDGLVEDFRSFYLARCEACAQVFELEPKDRVGKDVRCPSPFCGAKGTLRVEKHWSFEGDHEEAVDYLSAVSKAGKHLLRVINDILDLSSLEAGRTVTSPQMHYVAMILEEAARELKEFSESHGIKIITRCPDEQLNIFIDKEKLLQVLSNLMRNAIKFSSRGSVVEVEATVDDEGIVFSVKDSGIGIDEGAREVIFESFRQIDGSTTRAYGGTGLGLTITKRLVELLRGSIWLDSKVNVGSTFYVRLPRRAHRERTSKFPPSPGIVRQRKNRAQISAESSAQNVDHSPSQCIKKASE